MCRDPRRARASAPLLLAALLALACGCVTKPDVTTPAAAAAPPPTPGPFGVWSNGVVKLTVRSDSSAVWEADGTMCNTGHHYAASGRFTSAAGARSIEGSSDFTCGFAWEGGVYFKAQFDGSFTAISGAAHAQRWSNCGAPCGTNFDWQYQLVKISNVPAL